MVSGEISTSDLLDEIKSRLGSFFSEDYERDLNEEDMLKFQEAKWEMPFVIIEASSEDQPGTELLNNMANLLGLDQNYINTIPNNEEDCKKIADEIVAFVAGSLALSLGLGD
ncbi:hypothetical protein ACFL24_00770 [Patescibacteria group bacterium]